MCSGLSRRARMPACTPGCRVLMRPSMISGKPVRSLTGCASSAASWIALSVLPVAYSSKPSLCSPRANPERPCLSLTDRTAFGKLCLHQPDGLGQDPVLGLMHSLAQRFNRIPFQDRDGLLDQDRPGVEAGGDNMHGRTGDPRPTLVRSLHGVHATSEFRKKGRVDVDDPFLKGFEERFRMNSVVARI